MYNLTMGNCFTRKVRVEESYDDACNRLWANWEAPKITVVIEGTEEHDNLRINIPPVAIKCINSRCTNENCQGNCRR
jgi:hypothetical protein